MTLQHDLSGDPIAPLVPVTTESGAGYVHLGTPGLRNTCNGALSLLYCEDAGAIRGDMWCRNCYPDGKPSIYNIISMERDWRDYRREVANAPGNTQ